MCVVLPPREVYLARGFTTSSRHHHRLLGLPKFAAMTWRQDSLLDEMVSAKTEDEGLARDRTGIDGIRIRRDSHYTTKPCAARRCLEILGLDG